MIEMKMWNIDYCEWCNGMLLNPTPSMKCPCCGKYPTEGTDLNEPENDWNDRLWNFTILNNECCGYDIDIIPTCYDICGIGCDLLDDQNMEDKKCKETGGMI